MILAAGEGTRLRPLTLERPKPMLPIGGRPLLEHLILWLRDHGITCLAINLHYKPDTVRAYFGDGAPWGVEITYSLEDPILGTAGAVKKLQDYFADTFVVVYGDLLTNMDLTRLIRFHNAHKVPSVPSVPSGPSGSSVPSGPSGSSAPFLTLALYRVSNPTECGLVALDGQGRIKRFVEKPPAQAVFTDLANAGIFILEPAVIDYIPPDTFYDFGHDLFPRLLREGVPMYGYPISEDEYLIDIGTLEKYQRAQRQWAGR
jgi:NDP-sugar pyrophosphorylase family protein